MARRRSGDPCRGWEPLEGRAVMSHAAAVAGFGAVGDSLTDEYRFNPPDRSQARNWVEILGQTRKLDFGTYTTSSRGLPRDQGYANDWALSSATGQQVVGGQLPGLAAQVASGKVRYASVNMGTDDYLEFLAAAAPSIASTGLPSNYGASLFAVEQNALADFKIAADTLLAANADAKLAVATISDPAQVPAVAQYLGIPAAAEAVGLAEDAVEAENAQIRAFAAANPSRVALVDLAAEGAALAGQSSFRYGSATIGLTRTGDDDHDFILADGIHPGTVGQGLIAEAFVQAVDSLGAGIKPLAPAVVLRYAATVQAHPSTTR